MWGEGGATWAATLVLSSELRPLCQDASRLFLGMGIDRARSLPRIVVEVE